MQNGLGFLQGFMVLSLSRHLRKMVSSSAYVSGQKRPVIDWTMSCEGYVTRSRNKLCCPLLRLWVHLLLLHNLGKWIDSFSLIFRIFKAKFDHIAYIAFYPVPFPLTLFRTFKNIQKWSSKHKDK